jgi:hypothetical protein
MKAMLKRGRGSASIRLAQGSFNMTPLLFYAGLSFF